MEQREHPSAADIEGVISSLVNVKSSRVVVEKGVVAEIHVLTDSSRAPKQVVRDIESAIMAEFGVELDHKKISIAQTQDGRRFRFVDSRLKFQDVSLSLNGVKSEAKVRLRKGDDIFSGATTGPSTGYNQLRLVAAATLKAIEACQGIEGVLMLDDMDPGIQLSGHQAVVVCISVITPRGDEYVTGSALVKQDVSKAVVNATLDAVNRRLGSLVWAGGQLES